MNRSPGSPQFGVGAYVLSVLAASLAALASPSLAADPSQCRLVRIAEWPVRLVNGLPVMEGSINGKTIGVLLDTGAYASMVTKAAAEKLGLFTRRTSEIAVGFGGESNVLQTRIDELRIGDAVSKNLRVRVGGERAITGVDLILGDDFFKNVDIEFHYAKGIVRLFQPLGCRGVALAYWDRNALQLSMEGEDKIIVPIRLNGRAAQALIDSGAGASVVDLSFAAKLGIAPDSTGTVSSGCSSGIGRGIAHSWVARFDALEIAEQTIRDPRLEVSDYWTQMAPVRDAPPEVILGTDFLRAHRVFASRSQGKVYFSYIGGQVFPTTPRLECDERVRGKGMAEALAIYDQAIAENANDTGALLQRATLRERANNAKGALSDLDAVIRIEPGNAVALRSRSRVRAMLKDYGGALADAAAAIANGMRTAYMHVARAQLHRVQGDFDRAIEEYGEALKLDPRHQGALRGRGRYHFHTGRFEAAENDFETLLAMRPNGFDSVWLSISRSRRGLNGNAALEQGVAMLKDGAWPGPILQYLLGRLDRDALIAAAASPDEKKRRAQECEARFYIGMRLVISDHVNDARPFLEAARDRCPRNFIEYDASLAELAKLK